MMQRLSTRSACCQICRYCRYSDGGNLLLDIFDQLLAVKFGCSCCRCFFIALCGAFCGLRIDAANSLHLTKTARVTTLIREQITCSLTENPSHAECTLT